MVVVDEGDLILDPKFTSLLVDAWPRRMVLLSALPREGWTARQELSFTTAKGKKNHYVDVKSVFPKERMSTLIDKPNLLKNDADDILRFAAEKAKTMAVLFYGSSTLYGKSASWANMSITPVGDKIREDAEAFLVALKTAEKGIFFLEADGDRDLGFLRGVDYRSTTQNGICLILASQFKDKSTYLQARGRVKRSSDEGECWALPRRMWSK